MGYNVVITDDRFGNSDEERAIFCENKEIDVQLDILSLGDEKETIDALSDVDAVLVNLHPLPAAVIGKMKKCRVISRYGVGYDNVDVDAATKAGMHGFTKSLALETARKNITVNTISPGYIATAMTDALSDSIKKMFVDIIPMKRFGTPEEVAHVVKFLVSDEAAYITGQVISINGGMLM